MKSLPKVLTLAALILTFVVIVLGAYTRLKDAGLGCPDWPGCYGTLTVPQSAEQIQVDYPDARLDKSKAWIEVTHRMVAGSLGLFVFFLTYLDFRVSRRHKYKVSRILIFASLMVVGQSLLGMWTVTLQLLPQVVTAHLFGGLSIFSLLFLRWAHLHLNSNSNDKIKDKMKTTSDGAKNISVTNSPVMVYAYIGLALVIMQIFLGGWVSTNYASLACTDFPLCNGEWIPSGDFGGGFNLLHPIGENYEGGVLNDAAQVAIHWAHRMGALLVTLFWVSFYLVAKIKKWAVQDDLTMILGILILQIILGITNVLGDLPLLVATAHNGMAAILLLSVIWLLVSEHHRRLLN